MKTIAILLLLISSASSQCRKVSIAWQDDLGDIIMGYPHSVSDKFPEKLAKKFNFCYDPEASTVLFLSGKPATYHGVQRRTDDSRVTGNVYDTGGAQTGTMDGKVETTTLTPYEVGYQLLYLTVQRNIDGKKVVVQSFSGKTLRPTMYGACIKNCHPVEALITDAVKWLAKDDASLRQ